MCVRQLAQAYAGGLFKEGYECDSDDEANNGENGNKGKNKGKKKNKGGKNRQVKVKVKQPASVSSSSSSSSSSNDGQLYSFKVRLDLPPDPSYTPGQRPKLPFHTNELVTVSSPGWKALSPSSDEAFLGVVHSWSSVYRKDKPPGILVKLLVCTSSAGVGGDGAGGRGGWLPLQYIQEGIGAKKGQGIPVTMSSAGGLVTACREFQAIMSLPALPEGIRRCLLDPSVSKEHRAPPARPRSSSFSTQTSTSTSTSTSKDQDSRPRLSSSQDQDHDQDQDGGAEGGGGGGAGVNSDAASQCVPPPNVPDKLWRCVVGAFNRSQVLAIRKVAEGSPSGFTLLQVR